MNRRLLTLTLIFFSFIVASNGQEREVRTLTLEECIKTALENNLNLKLARNDHRIAEVNYNQSKFNYLPDLNGSASYNANNSLQFDRGAIFNQTVGRINSGLETRVNLFNGFNNINTRRRDQLALEATLYDLEDTKQITELNVLNAYLNALNDIQNISISIERLGLLTEQLKRSQKRVEMGVDNLEQVYNLESEIANENLNKVTLENLYQTDLLSLLQLIQLDPIAYKYELEELDASIEDITSPENYREFYQEASAISPSLKSAEIGKKVSQKNLLIAKSATLPSVSFVAGIATSYSSNGALNPNFDPNAPEGTPNSFSFDPNAEFGDQFFDINPQKYFGVNMNVPIFTRFANKSAIERARVNVNNAEISQQQAKLNFENNLQQAYLNLLNAQSNYNAAVENFEALDQSFKFNEASYSAGRIDFYTYLQSLNNKTRGEITLNQSKTSVILRKKILDIYRGEL
ncbi:MAG: TolC family protein [Bacteroidota bacterium]